jgi:very-short-patch-repair endonuclease
MLRLSGVAATSYRPVELRGQFFHGRQAIEAGLLTRGQLQSSAWRRLFHGIYVDSSVDLSHEMRCLVACALILPDGGVIAGRSAATVHGVGLTHPLDPVEALVSYGATLAGRPEMRLHRGFFGADEVELVRGMSVTTKVRTCWDLARWLPLPDSAVFIDQMLARSLVTIADFAAYVRRRAEEHPRPHGLRKAQRVLPLLDGRAESAPESSLRVRFVLAGLPPPRVQFNVSTRDGRFIARVDLAWPEFRIAVEYDGLWHVGSRAQMEKDRARLNALVSAGWTVLHVTATRMRDDFDGIVSEVRATMRRSRRS